MILTNPSVALLETILSTLSGINWLLNEIRYIKHWLGNNANILFEVTPIPLCYIRCLQNHKQREHYTCWFWKKIEDIYVIQFSICNPVGKNIISKHFLMFLPTEHEFITILEYGVRANGYSQSRSHFKCKRSIVEIRRSIAFGKIVLLHTHRILERWPEYWWEDKVFSKLQAFLEGRKCKNINIFTPKVLCACPSANSYARWKCEIYIVKPKKDPERVVSGDKIAYKTLTERNFCHISEAETLRAYKYYRWTKILTWHLAHTCNAFESSQWSKSEEFDKFNDCGKIRLKALCFFGKYLYSSYFVAMVYLRSFHFRVLNIQKKQSEYEWICI